MPIFGCDLSDFDWARGSMDVASMVRDGISFLTAKATEGTHIQHVHYGEALTRARDAGMPFEGAYIVVRTPGNNGHGSIPAQVDYFLAYLDAQTPWWRSTREFFLQVDTEHWSDSNGVVYDAVAPQYGVQACDLLRAQTGKSVVHYAPRWAYGDTIGGDHPLWASSYGTNPAVPYRNAYPGDGSSGWAPYSGRTPTILQYGSRLTIGSQPGCDGNAFRGTIDQFRALITGTAHTSEAPDMNVGDGILVEKQLKSLPVGDVGVQVSVGEALAAAVRAESKVDALAATVAQAAGGTVTQEMHDAAVSKTMNDPAWLTKFAAAVASHIHVS